MHLNTQHITTRCTAYLGDNKKKDYKMIENIKNLSKKAFFSSFIVVPATMILTGHSNDISNNVIKFFPYLTTLTVILYAIIYFNLFDIKQNGKNSKLYFDTKPLFIKVTKAKKNAKFFKYVELSSFILIGFYYTSIMYFLACFFSSAIYGLLKDINYKDN